MTEMSGKDQPTLLTRPQRLLARGSAAIRVIQIDGSLTLCRECGSFLELQEGIGKAVADLPSQNHGSHENLRTCKPPEMAKWLCDLRCSRNNELYLSQSHKHSRTRTKSEDKYS